ncbi:MAG: class I SAM-dependent methyltransferase [Terriglobales bacterium]
MGFDAKFGRVASEFDRYRPGYPPDLFVCIFAAVQARDRALDLGAGTGISTRVLLEHFGEVIAVEPDPGMAAFLRQSLPGAEVRNVTAEEDQQPDASLDLITIANALHWMDVPAVLERARRWLRPGGILAVYDRPMPRAGAACDAVTLAELRGNWKPFWDHRLERVSHWQVEIRAAAGFTLLEESKFPNLVPMSAHDYTGFWRSTSFASAYARTLADPEPYWRDLEARLAAAAPEPALVDLSSTLLLLATDNWPKSEML